jgi:hypothetical protein
MTTNLETAPSRLRNADPAAATRSTPRGGPARAGDADQDPALAATAPWPHPNRTRRRGRRLARAGALVTALALSAVAGVVSMPWSHGRMSSVAYAVTQNADGTVGLTIHWNQRRHPDALNARLRRAGVRAAVMLYSAPGQCRTAVRTDPAHTIMRLDLRRHPELAYDPQALAAHLRSQTRGWIAPSNPATPSTSRCSPSIPTRSRAVTSC